MQRSHRYRRYSRCSKRYNERMNAKGLGVHVKPFYNEYMKTNTKRCPECGNDKDITEFWRGDCYCKPCSNARKRRYRAEGRLTKPSKEKLRRQQLTDKVKVLTHYGESCKCCGFQDIRALCVDHINGDGHEHRKTVPSGHLYRWLIANNFPVGFQTLCCNCNRIKQFENDEFAHHRSHQ